MMTEAQQTILLLTAAALFEPSLEIPQSADWRDVRREARMHAVQLLALSVADKYLQSEEKKSWKNMVNPVIVNNMRVTYEHCEVEMLMRKHRIPYVVLKGVSSAAYYRQPDLRSLGDVDFMVAEKHVHRVGRLLEEHGFSSKKDDTGDIHIAYHRPPNSIWELHRGLVGMPGGAVGMKCREYMKDVMETAVELHVSEGTCRVPDKFHHGLILLLHTAAHLTSEGIGLRHLCDWAVFYASLPEEEFQALFEEKLKACGLWQFACLLTLTSVKYLHAPKRSWAGEADEMLLEAIISDILNGGNFGKKDMDRYRQIKYISNRGKHTVDGKGVLFQVMDTIGEKAKAESKTKTKVLLDYVKLVVQGKRKSDTFATLKAAEKRKNIYQEFHLFEVQKN